MFERFTNRARRVLVLAQEEAAALHHDFIGTEHILLGMVHEREGIAGQVLTEMGLTLEGLRTKIADLIGPTIDGAPKKKPPFTPRAKKVLELALREALNLKHNYIGTEHLLLGLLREGEGVGAQVIVAAGGTLANVRQQVIAKLQGYNDPLLPPKPVAASRPQHTPALEAIIPKAEEVANGSPIGSHHLLLAIVDEPDSLAARVLESFGVTREALIERFTSVGTSGTTDDVPEPDPFTLHVFEGGLTIRIDDEDLAEKVRRGELTVAFKPTA
jgi:ATP-dependent Clp protease ATP-binding subunit ClpA